MCSNKELIGKTYPSNFHGPMEIIECEKRDNVLVRFLESGHTRYISLSKIKSGSVKDKSIYLAYAEGTIHPTKNFGFFKVIKYRNADSIDVEFLATKYRTTTKLKCIKEKSVKDPYAPRVYGVGYMGTKYPAYIGKKRLKEYQLWSGILQRCYCPKTQKIHPTYKECTVSDNFKSYEYFYEWCQVQVGFGNEGWEIDKDLLFKGNKIYSEDTCVFLPPIINTALTKSNSIRGSYPIGVSKEGNRYKAEYNDEGTSVYLGMFDTPEQAFQAYKEKKQRYLLKLAFKWGERLDPRAERALYQYEVDIND